MPTDIKEIQKSILSGGSFALVGSAAFAAMKYLQRLVLARVLSPDQYGIFSLGLMIFMVTVSVGLLGIQRGVNRFVPYFRAEGEEGKVKGTLLGGSILALISGVVFAVGLFILARFLSLSVFEETSLLNVIRVFVFAVPAMILLRVLIRGLEGFKKINYSMGLKTGEIALRLLGIIVVSLAGFELLAVPVVFIVSTWLVVIMGYWLLREKVFPLFNPDIPAHFELGKLFHYSWPLFLTGILNLVVGWTDTFMIGFFSDSADVGVYNVALPTSQMIILLLQSISVIFLPLATEAFSRGEEGKLREIFNISYRWVFLATLPVYLFMVLFAQPIIVLVFGAEYAAGAGALVVLSSGFFLASLSGPTQKLFNSLGRTRLVLGLTSSAALVNVALNLVLVPRLGIIGAAIATATSLGVGSMLNLVFLYRVSDIFPLGIFYLRPVIVGVASVGGLYLIEKMAPVSIPYYLVPLEVIIAFSLYGLGLYLTNALKEEDRQIIVTVYNAVREKVKGGGSF